jgi:putative PIN family toxin of toxin-antitoxin system
MAHRFGQHPRGGALGLRLVLDTHVWLDLLVFRDPVVALLADALRDGSVAALVEPRMLGELERVLGYPAFALARDARAAAMRDAVAMSTPVSTPAPLASAPRCRDPDDQMFVELALSERADALLSRDHALLRLAPRLRREGIEAITPAAWCAQRTAQISKR